MGSYNTNEFNTSPFVTTSVVGIDFDDEKGFHLIYGDKYAIEVTQSLQEALRDRYSLSIMDYENQRQVILKDSTLVSHETYSTFLNGEAFGIVNTRNINGYRELTFRIPYKIVDTDNNLIDNFRIPYCTEEYKVELYHRGIRDYYIIKEITDGYSNDGLKFREVYCWHYPFAKLSQSGNQLDFEYIDNAKNILTYLLDGSDWSVGNVSVFLEDDNPIEKIRTLKANGNTNRYELIQEMGEIFGGFPIFDAEFKRVHFVEDPRIDKGIVFRYGKNIKSYSIVSSTKELATKIWVEGGENDSDITYIDNATNNIMGEPYILDFDYFIEKGLLTAQQQIDIDSFKINVGITNGLIKDALNDMTAINIDLLEKEVQLESKVTSMTAKESTVTSLTNVRNATTDTTARSELLNQINALNSEISILDGEISVLESEIESLNIDLDTAEVLYSDYIDAKNALIQGLEDSAGDFIREKLYKNENYTDADSLYADALKVSKLASYPQYEETVSVLDLSKLTGYEIEEFDEYTKAKIVINELGIESDGQIREISQVLDDPRQTTCTISTFITNFEDFMSKSFSSTNDLKIMKETYNRSYGLNPDGTVNGDFLQRALQEQSYAINVESSSYIDPTKGFISVNIENPDELIKINSAGLALSRDGGSTWALALTFDGLVAEVVKAGSIDTKFVKIFNSDDGDITSGAGFYIDGDGLRAYNSSGIKTVEILNTGDAQYSGTVGAGSLIVGGSNVDGKILVKDASDATKVELNRNGIVLADGTEIVGGDGVLSLLHFNNMPNIQNVAFGNYVHIGYFIYDGGSMNEPSYITGYIPPNFTVVGARLRLRFMSLRIGASYYQASSIKVYKGDSNSTYVYADTFSSGSEIIDNTVYTDYTNSIFGATTLNPTAGSNIITYNGDITSLATTLFPENSNFTLKVQPTAAVAETNQGYVSMDLFIYGYYS